MPVFPSGTPRSRSALAVGLLVLALALVGVLAYQAHDAARSHRRVAERALGEHAAFAAWEYTGVLRRDIFVKGVSPGMDLVGSLGGKDPAAALGPLPRADSVARAWGWPHQGRWDYLFRLDLRDGTLAWVGPTEPPEADVRWIRDSLPAHAEAVYDADWDAAARLMSDQRFLAYRLYPAGGDGPRVAYGFRTDLGLHHYLFRAVVEGVPLLPPSLTNGHRTSDLLSVRVETPDGELLFASEPQYDSPYTARDTLGAVFAGIGTRVAVRPEAAESLVIGGLPASRLPLVLALLILTAGLMAAAILQLRREYELAMLRADFVSGVSHELRTPLAQIRMFAETLLLGRVRSEQERRRSLEILVKEARRLTHQVDNVLLFSRAERQGTRLSPETTDVTRLVRETAESFTPLAEAAGATLVVAVEDDVRARVDAEVFPQALLNLLDNAVKYGPPGQTVRLGLRRTPDGAVRAVVDDEGPGIPPRDREKIWEPYHRMERDRDSAVAGSGIGLAVVREVAKGLGGRAWVEDAPGGGARFIVELQADPEEADPEGSPPAGAEHAPTDPEPGRETPSGVSARRSGGAPAREPGP